MGWQIVYIKKGLTPYSIAEGTLVPQLYVLRLENDEEREARLARRRLIINVQCDSDTNRECSVYSRTICMWESKPEQQLEKSFRNSIPIVLRKRVNKHRSPHQKRPDSILHSWGNPGSTAVCAQHISTTYVDHGLRRQCQGVNKLETQETNRIYLFVLRCWALILPTLQAASKCLVACSSS